MHSSHPLQAAVRPLSMESGAVVDHVAHCSFDVPARGRLVLTGVACALAAAVRLDQDTFYLEFIPSTDAVPSATS